MNLIGEYLKSGAPCFLKRAKPGTALLLVVAVTSFLMIFATAFWHKFSLLHDLATQREKYYKNYYLTQTVLNWGTKIVAENFDLFIDAVEQEKLPINLNFDFLDKNSTLFLTIKEIKAKNKKIIDRFYLKSFLQHQGMAEFKLSCFLSKEQSSSDDKKYEFKISNYTIGSFL